MPPGSAMFLEFIKQGKEYYIRLFIKEYDKQEYAVSIPGLGEKIEMRQFEKHVMSRLKSEG